MVERDLEERKKEKNEIINILTTEAHQSRNMFSDSSNLSGVADYIKDMILQVNKAGKELSKKDERINFLEEIHRELKIAYYSAL